MKHYKEVIIPQRKDLHKTHTTCDICGETIQYEDFSANEVNISCRTGSAYPEGGWGEEIEYDVCVDCFTEHIIFFFKQRGTNPDWKEWEF